MTQEQLDEILDGEFFKEIPSELHKDGKNIIGYEPQLSKEYCYIIYPDKKACLISFDKEKQKSKIIRELTQDEYKILNIESL